MENEKTILVLVLQILKHFFGDFHQAQSLKLLGYLCTLYLKVYNALNAAFQSNDIL